MKIYNINLIGTGSLSGSLGTDNTQSFFTGSLFGTSSFSLTASFALNSNTPIDTSSFMNLGKVIAQTNIQGCITGF